MITVQGVSAAAEVVVIAIRSQHIVNIVVKSFETECVSFFVSFGSVIENNIQDYFNPVVMKCFDQCFQFRTFLVMFICSGIAAVRSKKSDSVVSPAFEKLFVIYGTGIHGLIKFEDRHQLHCIDSQFFQIRDFFHKSGKSSSMLNTGRRMMSKITYMQFVDDQVTEFFFGLWHITPVETVFNDTCMIRMVPADSPGTLTGNCFGIWVEQNFIFVKEQSFFRTVWSVYTVGIFKFINVQSIYDHGINITDLVSFRKRKYSKRFFLCTVEQKQFTGGSSACVNGKINTILQRSSPVQIVNSRTDRKTGDFCHRGRFIRMVRYKFLMIGFHFFLHF